MTKTEFTHYKFEWIDSLWRIEDIRFILYDEDEDVYYIRFNATIVDSISPIDRMKNNIIDELLKDLDEYKKDDATIIKNFIDGFVFKLYRFESESEEQHRGLTKCFMGTLSKKETTMDTGEYLHKVLTLPSCEQISNNNS
jgi:hypothetical protein